MIENMKIIARTFDTDFDGNKFAMTDILPGVCFINGIDNNSIELLADVAENTDWDKVKEAIDGRCDVNGSYGVGSNGLVMELQWTTGLEFADGHAGGGYIADVSFDWESPSIASIAVEWNDEWACEHELVNRDNEVHCMNLLVDAFKFGVENLLEVSAAA